MDELLWAALWLNKATDNVEEYYLNYLINKAHCFGGLDWAITEFSWDVKYAGVQILAAQVNISLSLSDVRVYLRVSQLITQSSDFGMRAVP